MKRAVLSLVVVACLAKGFGVNCPCGPTVARAQATSTTQGFVTGSPELKSIGALSFGPGGLLAIADPQAGAIVCLDTGDRKALPPHTASGVDAIDAALAAKLGTNAAGIRINDMQANPATGAIYFSVTKVDEQRPVLMKLDGEGKPEVVSLDNVKYGKVMLPTTGDVKLSTITDVEFSRTRVVVAAQANEEFGSKVYSIALPFTHEGKASVFSTETWHVSHNKMETRAPIRTLTSYRDGNQDYAVGAFTCTPVVKYPISDMAAGAVVKGTSVVELGSGNQPLDLFFYEKEARPYLLVSNNRHGVLKVTADVFKATDLVNEKALHRQRTTEGIFPAVQGIDVVGSMQGTIEMSPISRNQVAFLRKTDSGLKLEVSALP